MPRGVGSDSGRPLIECGVADARLYGLNRGHPALNSGCAIKKEAETGIAIQMCPEGTEQGEVA